MAEENQLFSDEEIESLKEVVEFFSKAFLKKGEEKPYRFLDRCFVCKTAAMFDSKDGITCGKSMCRDRLIDKINELEEKAEELEEKSRELALEEERNGELNSDLQKLSEAIKIIFPPSSENTPQIIRDLLEKCREIL